MDVNDLIIEVRDSNYNRVGQLLAKDITDLTIVAKFNDVGSWKLSLPSKHPLVDILRVPGSGLIVNGPSGVIISGPSVTAKKLSNFENPEGVWEIEGRDDSHILYQHLAYPTPTTSDVTAQTVAYDTRINFADVLMKQYVNYNIGPLATTARKIPNLTVEADENIGSTLTVSARMNKLNELIKSIASIDKLGYTVEQIDDQLIFRVYQPVDRSGDIRMDIENNQLSSVEYLYKEPEVTRVIVGGKGTAEQRTFLEVSNAESLAAETEWSRRIEVFHDARSSQTVEELTQAGLEQLIDKGKTIKSLSVTPNDYTTMQYGVDWGLGDIVSVSVDDIEIIQVVTEVGIIVNNNGVAVKATVGEPIKTDVEAALIYLQGKNDERLDNLERNAEAGATTNRQSLVYTSPILAPGEHHTTSVDIAGEYKILSISTTVESKVRLYTWETGQALDLNRPTGGYPEENVGLMFEGETYSELLSWDLSPVVDGFTRDGNASVPITVTNTSRTFTTPVQVTLIYIPLS